MEGDNDPSLEIEPEGIDGLDEHQKDGQTGGDGQEEDVADAGEEPHSDGNRETEDEDGKNLENEEDDRDSDNSLKDTDDMAEKLVADQQAHLAGQTGEADEAADEKAKQSAAKKEEEEYHLTDEERATMDVLDENGWAHIHHAAFRGFVKSVEKFISANEDQLEIETGDDLQATPLLLSVMNGQLETVKGLVDLGAKVYVINSQNHGVVELCAFKEYIDILEYFIELDHPKVPVWKNLIKFLASDVDDEAEAAAKCLRTLTNREDSEMNPNWEPAFKNAIVPTVSRVIKGTLRDEVKIEAFQVLLNLILQHEVKEQFMSTGGMDALVKHIKSSNNKLIRLAAMVMQEICLLKNYTDQCVQNGAILAMVKVLQTVEEPEVLVEVLRALANIAACDPNFQTAVGNTPNTVTALVGLFNDCTNKHLLLALTKAVAMIVKVHDKNQNAFINEGISNPLISLTRTKYKDIQLSSVEAIHALAENNHKTQRAILEEGTVVVPLMQLLRKSRQTNIQETTAAALWALAGEDMEERRTMAGMMGVQLLIEFLTSMSEELHYIGSEGLGVLAQGPLGKQSAIATANGVHPLVRLLRSDKEHIVLSVIRTLRYLAVGVGFLPHTQNQATVAQSRGIKFLVAMMAHSKNELIQVEAAHTLGSIALGNTENLEEIQQNMDFSYIRILKMMYSKDPLVRLLAGAALASFAYNSLVNQKEIAEQGGVRFSCFVPFLQSEDEFFRANAAFQVVVLARIIPDEEQAISSAAGIKLLVDLLQDSKSNEILGLAADCIARLAHTRAGVPAAFVSIGAMTQLCDLLTASTEQVRGCAAVALGYLSYNHQAKRELLNRCRVDPYLMKILTYYTNKSKLSPEFIEGWKHYKQIGLPPISSDRPNLVSQKNDQYSKSAGRPMTIASLDETGASTNQQSSPTNLNGALPGEDDKTMLTGSRSSRISHNSGDLTQRSRGSISSHNSRVPGLPQELTAEDG